MKLTTVRASCVFTILSGLAAAGRADPLDAANYSRMRGCPQAGSRTALGYNQKLQLAADRLAHGAALAASMAAAGYLALESVVVHVSGANSDADISRSLINNYCRVLTDANIREFGAVRRGHEVWMVLAAPAAAPPTSGADAAKVQRQILDLVNVARATGRRCGTHSFAAAPALGTDPALASAALEHSRDMAAHDEFEHGGHDGSTPAQRLERAGYGEHRIVGENIAAGAMSAAEVVQGWLASPPHCENIMDPRFTQMGIGYAENLHTSSGVFWTQDFAAHR